MDPRQDDSMSVIAILRQSIAEVIYVGQVFDNNQATMLRKILPLILINWAVITAFAIVAVAKPNYVRAAAVFIPLLFLFNFFYFRNIQRKQAKALAAGTATPPSPATRRLLMWGLGVYGAVLYISAALNLPTLFAQHDFAPWLGWSVKVGMGTLWMWLAFRIRKTMKTVLTETVQPK